MEEVQVLETPVKSGSDKKEYRLIRLPNGLKAILIKEFIGENTELRSQRKDIAAASLAINVGSFDDPPNAMGLAHFLEHVVFLGSTKYPLENGFDDFLQANGGNGNAMTRSEVTTFFFNIAEKVFPEALDIFAQQLIAPLLLKDAMQREREIVDSEFKMALSNDTVIEESIYKAMIFESHPASQFLYGNLKTLQEEIEDDDLHAELLKLHTKYVGSKTYLAVQSSRSLDELQDLVVKCFLAMKKGDDEEPPKLLPSVDDIFKPEFFNQLYFVKPKTVGKTLTLAWAFPPLQKFYKCSPVDYIAKIFGNDGDGGLASYLRDAHLITSIEFESNAAENTLFCMPKCQVNLTDLGLTNIGKVLEGIFSYLLMIKETSIEDHRRFFHELKEKQETLWKFATESSAIKNVEKLMMPMMLYEDCDVLRGESATFIDFDEEIISWVIESLNEPKFNILISNNERESYTRKERYFGADYDAQDVPETYRKIWDERQLKPEFFLEKSNPFSATNFAVFSNEEESTQLPVKIYNDEIYGVWHKLDNKFQRPEASVIINFLSPNVMSSIHSHLYLKIYDEMLNRFLKKKYAQAKSANLDVKSTAHDKSLTLKFSGFNEKIETLIEMVAMDLKDFVNRMDTNVFETIKFQLKKKYYNLLMDCQDINGEFIHEVLYDNFYHGHELLKEIENISFEKLQKCMLKFFSKLKIHVLAQGNIMKSQALNVVRTLQEHIVCQLLEGDYNLRKQCYQLPLGTTMLRVKSLNPNDDNSQIKNCYQIGPETLRRKSLAKLVVSILDSKAFDYLRTKEQLGYSVGIELQENSGVLGINVTVSSQEHKHSFTEVYAKIEIFMNEIAKKTIKELTDDEFEQFKESHFKKSVADFSTLSEETTANWDEITKEDYVFDRKELTATVTEALTKSELQEFFRSFTEPENMRKLSVQVIGNQKGEGTVSNNNDNSKDPLKLKIEFLVEKLSEEENVIINIDEFHEQMILYPVVNFEI